MDEINVTNAACNESALRRAPLMAKWLWVLFWIQIVSVILSVGGAVPALDSAVSVVGLLVSIVVCVIYCLLKGEDPRYKTVAVLGFVTMILNALNNFVFASAGAAVLSTLCSLIIAVMGLVMAYNMYHAHHDVVSDADPAVGARWLDIWKWKIISIVLVIASAVLTLLLPFLGMLLLFVSTIFVLIVMIIEMVNLYRSAQVYRALIK